VCDSQVSHILEVQAKCNEGRCIWLVLALSRWQISASSTNVHCAVTFKSITLHLWSYNAFLLKTVKIGITKGM